MRNGNPASEESLRESEECWKQLEDCFEELNGQHKEQRSKPARSPVCTTGEPGKCKQKGRGNRTAKN